MSVSNVSIVARGCVALLISVGSAGLMATAMARAEDPKAARLLAQARQALGGEAKLAAVQSLTATGGSMRQMPDRTQIGDLRIDLRFPDRLLRTDSHRGLGSEAIFVMLRGLDGGTLLRKSTIINGGPGHRMSQPPIVGGSEAEALRSARHEVTRFAIALLLTPPPSADAKFADGGEAESPDGKADVLVVTGANGFAARVFLDRSTHRPLMMMYRDFDPRFIIPPRPGDPPAAARSPDRMPVDLTWYFDDYKSVSGIQLPHRISRAIDGEPDEDWTFSRIVLNPTFAADAFSDK